MYTKQLFDSLFEYDPTEGVLTSKATGLSATRVRVRKSDGYTTTYANVGRKAISVARIAWTIMTGEVLTTDIQIDHENVDATDNRWFNLRKATAQENSFNRRKRVDNTSGFKGVSFNKQSGTYQAYIYKGGKKFSLGLYKTPEEAYEARCRESHKFHGDFANNG